MREIRTSGLMSGEGRRIAHATPRLSSTPCELCETLCPLDCFAAAAAGTAISHAITAHAPNRLSRLRGSMYSFIDTASRNSPMNVITTSTTGNAIHHQMPATSAVCWLAQ